MNTTSFIVWGERMRTATVLAVVIAFAMTFLAFLTRSYLMLAFAIIALPGFGFYIYGARLADTEHKTDHKRFKPFIGTSNLPIYGALWRASMAGDRVAKWALTYIIALPILAFLFVVFGHVIAKGLVG
jgi:hypothetical protein